MMYTHAYLKNILTRYFLACGICLLVTTALQGDDAASPGRIVEDYLASLYIGDTQRLRQLIAGSMRAKNQQLIINSNNYSQFLKDYYTGVQAVVEEIIPEGEHMQARVRFHYPTAQTTDITFVLEQIDGQWKITDEKY